MVESVHKAGDLETAVYYEEMASRLLHLPIAVQFLKCYDRFACLQRHCGQLKYRGGL
jgi:hypothetical protein